MTVRNWRTQHKEYTDTELLKRGKQALALRRVSQAIRNGTLKRGDTCQTCGDKCETVAHHYKGYDKPFSVWWICRVCNANLDVHDGSLTLEQARDYLRAIYVQKFVRRMGIQQWTQKQGDWCGVCDAYCRRNEMHEVDDMMLCHHCFSDVFQQEG